MCGSVKKDVSSSVNGGSEWSLRPKFMFSSPPSSCPLVLAVVVASAAILLISLLICSNHSHGHSQLPINDTKTTTATIPVAQLLLLLLLQLGSAVQPIHGGGTRTFTLLLWLLLVLHLTPRPPTPSPSSPALVLPSALHIVLLALNAVRVLVGTVMVDPLKIFWVLTNSTYLGNVPWMGGMGDKARELGGWWDRLVAIDGVYGEIKEWRALEFV